MFAAASTSLAGLIRVMGGPLTGDAYATVLFAAAVAASAWYGGYRAGALAALLSYLVENYLFISPQQAFDMPSSADMIAAFLHFVSSGIIIALIHDLKRESAAADSLADNLAQTLEGGDVVCWQWENAAATVRFSENARRILGIGRLTLTPLQLMRRFVPADRRRLVRALRGAATGPARMSAELRFLRPDDGALIWLRCQARVSSAGGRPLSCVHGVFIDDTPRLRAEVALRDAEARFRKSHDGSLRGYSLFTRVRSRSGETVDFTWAYVNPAGARLVRRRVGDLVGMQLTSVIPDVPARRRLLDLMKAVSESGMPQEVDLYYEVRRVRACIRHMIVQTDDGVAVESFDITKATMLEGELRRIAHDLETANRRKSEFVALLAHELRTPLAPVRTAVQILSMRVADPALRRVLDIMERQVLHIARLIDDLLDVARIERGRIDLHREKTLVADVVRHGVELSQVNIEARHHTLVLDVQIPHVYLDVDSMRIAQVISNLLNNAAKFMSPGGRISLSARKQGAMCEIAVKDEGRGIARGDLDRIFERFVQLTREGCDPGSGLGLGLALVKSLAELHGGAVRVHSEGIDRGSEFVVALPIALDVRDRAETGHPAEAAPCPDVQGKRVLIVDDDRDTVEVLGQALAAAGMKVSQATGGMEALDIAQRARPDVMLVDLRMPALDGCDIARAIRAGRHGADVLLLALSGWGQDEDKERALAAGFDYHLTKPVAVQAILELVAMSSRCRGPAGPLRSAVDDPACGAPADCGTA